MTRLLLAAYLMEAGVVLTVGPWTVAWERNYFAHVWPWLGVLMFNAYVRGAVTGVGVITAIAGIRDLLSAMSARQAGAPSADGPQAQP